MNYDWILCLFFSMLVHNKHKWYNPFWQLDFKSYFLFPNIKPLSLFPAPSLQTAQVCRIMHGSKPCKTDCRRLCKPTSGFTTREGGCSTPRWSKSWPTCEVLTRSTPNSTAHCPFSRSTACSSLHWCWRCLAMKSPRSNLRTSVGRGGSWRQDPSR